MSTDAPCDAATAVARGRVALSMGGQYGLGSGDYNPDDDKPWTPSPDRAHPGPASDCAGFAICYAWKLKRHRPGFNRGWWATVSDDINNNSAEEDGLHKQELFVTLGCKAYPQPGDLLMYPTIHLSGHTFIGHVGLVEVVPPDYKPGEGWRRLTILQCHGPDGFKPGVVRTDGSVWDHHDGIWPRPEHRSVIVRPKERK